MTKASVADLQVFLQDRTREQEKIEVCLWKLEALITSAVASSGFYDQSAKILHNYFSIAEDLIASASVANRTSLHELMRGIDN